MLKSIAVVAVVCWWGFVTSSVTITQVQTIYDRTPALNIRGHGFGNDPEEELLLDLSSSGSFLSLSPGAYTISRDVSGDGITLKLLSNNTWVNLTERTPPVMLILKSVKFGSNPVQELLVSPTVVATVLATPTGSDDEGAQVGTVKKILDESERAVFVEDTADAQLVYNGDTTLNIRGRNFNPTVNTLKFANGLMGNGVNYTIVATFPSLISLRLVPGSAWFKYPGNLPASLTLLEIDTGSGSLPINSGKGCKVATVFERPTVLANGIKSLYLTQSRELHLVGRGFLNASYPYRQSVEVSVDGILGEGVDYTLQVVSRTELVLTLVEGRAWGRRPGTMVLLGVNTRGDAAGWVRGYMMIAVVSQDISYGPVDGVQVYPSGANMYQSALQRQLFISGLKFEEGMELAFDPPLAQTEDYSLEVVSPRSLHLTLLPGKKWRQVPGPLLLTHVNVHGVLSAIGSRLGNVLADPVLEASDQSVHLTQTRLLHLRGSGFTYAQWTRVVLRAPSQDAYSVHTVTADTISLLLKPNEQWWSPSISPGNDSSHAPLRVVSIDTGAGEVVLDPPVRVGYVVTDIEGAVCDDSCEFAFDGVCDDPRGQNTCALGSDCTDCGPSSPFTNNSSNAVNSSDAHSAAPTLLAPPSCSPSDPPSADVVPPFYFVSAVPSAPPTLSTPAPSDPPSTSPTPSLVESTGTTQQIYHDKRVVYVRGNAAQLISSELRWSNQMRSGVDYFPSLVDHSTLALRRADSFTWFSASEVEQSPRVLYLEAVDGVEVQVSVATVFQGPVLQTSRTKLYRTESRFLHVQGSGFRSFNEFPVLELTLQFNSQFTEGDFYVNVVNHTHLLVALRPGAEWSKRPGPLLLRPTYIAKEGSELPPGEGVQVAEILADHTRPDPRAWNRVVKIVLSIVLVVGLAGLWTWSSGMRLTCAVPAESPYYLVPNNEQELEQEQELELGTMRRSGEDGW